MAKTKKRFFTKRQLSQLVSHKTLEMHQTLNLTQRCSWILKNWGVKIHRNALSNVYRNNGIHFLQTKYHFHLRGQRDEKAEEQKSFVIKLLQWLIEDRDVLYMDESSCCLW